MEMTDSLARMILLVGFAVFTPVGFYYRLLASFIVAHETATRRSTKVELTGAVIFHPEARLGIDALGDGGESNADSFPTKSCSV
jgi:hypothetical protein